MDNNAFISYLSLAISIASVVLGIVNHKRVRSNCCGRIGVVSLDVEPTTPNTEPLATKNQNNP